MNGRAARLIRRSTQKLPPDGVRQVKRAWRDTPAPERAALGTRLRRGTALGAIVRCYASRVEVREPHRCRLLMGHAGPHRAQDLRW